MVQLTQPPTRERVLKALDETPQTVQRLARRLGAEPEDIEARLEAARQEKLAVDWGEVWATTWRAKLRLSPRFFRVWIPVSLALGAGLTAVALLLNVSGTGRMELTGGLGAIAVAAGALAVVAIVRGDS